MAVRKYIKNASGTLTEEAAVNSSAGAADEGKIPALNASGVLDSTIVNSKTTSAGAGDSGKLPALDAAGRLDTSFMPVGIGADTQSIVSSENLAAGDLVNVWNDTGTPKVRKADATTAGKEAHGFVLAGVTAPAAATVYFEGNNTQVTGLTAGAQFLQTTAGLAGATAPSGSGNVVQRVGFASAATNLNFTSGDPVVLA